MKKIIFILSLLLLFFVSSVSSTALGATTILSDNFNDDNVNDGSPVDWEEFSGPQGNWQVSEGIYTGTVVKEGPPDTYSYSLAGNTSMSNYSFSVKVRGDDGIDKKIMFRYLSTGTRYDVNLINGNSANVQKWLNGSEVGIWWGSYNTTSNIWYSIRVEALSNNIKLFINDQKVIDLTDNNDPILSGKVGLQIWPGYYGGYGSRTTTSFDDVQVTSLDAPTLNNIVILPGIGASWNFESLLWGFNQPPENWTMMPVIKSYDGLVQTLKNAGYETEGPDKNLFIFNYDWRKPVSVIANDLKAYLERHPAPEGRKIDLVGHSMGGLVARAYLQNNPENNINKLVSIGTPNKGAVKAYYVWEGADFAKGLTGWQRYITGILVMLHSKFNKNDVGTIQFFLPSIGDLLPTFNYLRNPDGSEKSLSEMSNRNLWLENLNTSPLPSSLTSKALPIVGFDHNTLRWLNVRKNNELERALGRWVDGRPIKEEVENGDDSVLPQSGQLEGTTAIELSDTDHGDLVETVKGQQAIVDTLELSPSEIVPAPMISYIPAIVLQIASPAVFDVYSPKGIKLFNKVKTAVVPDPQKGKYKIEVYPEGIGGKYRLFIGRLTQKHDVWTEIDNSIKPGQVKKHFVNFDPTLIETKTELINSALEEIISAESKAKAIDNSSGKVLSARLKKPVKITELAIYLFSKGLDSNAQNQLENIILDLIDLEADIKESTSFPLISEGDKTYILNLIYNAKVLFTEAYDIE